jgi:hypothetical protein
MIDHEQLPAKIPPEGGLSVALIEAADQATGKTDALY